MRTLSRPDWLALLPELYLANGYLDEAGVPRPDFLGDYATAAANQLLVAEASPQEVSLTVEGLRLLVPLQNGTPGARLAAAIDECLLVVARAIRQENNGELVKWLSLCAAAVTTEADLKAFLAYVTATMRLYAMLVATLPDTFGPGSSVADSSGADSSGAAARGR